MMLATLSLLLPLALPQGESKPQGTAPPPPRPPSRSWWEQQSPERQAEMRQRMERLRELPEEAREELQRRRKLIEEERADILKHLSEEEKQQYEALDGHAQRRFLDERLRLRLEARGEELRRRFPHADGLKDHPEFAERLREGRRLLSERRGKQIREQIAQAVADGWLGPRTAAWLERAGIEESMAVLGEVRKWQFIEAAGERGLWQEMGIDEARRLDLMAMPPPEFFREMRHVRRPPMGPPPPGPGSRRGPGPGPEGPPGDGLGPGHGPGSGHGLGPDGPPPGGPPRGSGRLRKDG